VVSFLEHLKRHLGIHAVVLVAYQNPEMKIKISECVYRFFVVADSDVFLALRPLG
jgi:hypothetical protein